MHTVVVFREFSCPLSFFPPFISIYARIGWQKFMRNSKKYLTIDTPNLAPFFLYYVPILPILGFLNPSQKRQITTSSSLYTRPPNGHLQRPYIILFLLISITSPFLFQSTVRCFSIFEYWAAALLQGSSILHHSRLATIHKNISSLLPCIWHQPLIIQRSKITNHHAAS